MKCPMIVKVALSSDLLLRAGDKAIRKANILLRSSERATRLGKPLDIQKIKKIMNLKSRGFRFFMHPIKKEIERVGNIKYL